MTHETHSPSLTHVVLTLIAITGLALFILACRPSWSPDGRRVVYSYYDEGAQKAAVVVFDRKTRTSKNVFEMSSDGSGSKNILTAQWSKDGQRLLVLMGRGGSELTVVSLPQNPRKSVQMFSVAEIADSDEFGLLPFPEVKGQLFVIGDKVRARVNLDTGQVLSHKDQESSDNDMLLFDAGEKIIYLRQIEKKQDDKQADAKVEPGTKRDTTKSAEGFEFGELDQKDLTPHPTVTLTEEELKAKGVSKLSPFLDVYPSTMKIAVTEDNQETSKGKQERILIIGQNGVERVLEAGIKDRPFKLGNPQWSLDGKTIYVAAQITDDKAKTSQFAVVELSADGNTSRIDSITQAPQDEMGSDYLSATQIALSPDGKFIAASNGYTDSVKPEQIGLFLLDLTKSNRPVNFYPAPRLPKLPDKE